MGQSAFAHTQQVCESSRWRAVGVGVGVGTAGGGRGGGRGCRTSGREGEGGLEREEKRELALNPIALCRGDHWHLLINNKCIPE